MKKISNYFRLAVMATLAMVAFACGKDDPKPTPEPEPEPEVKIDCQQVYFSPDNSDFILVEDGKTTVSVKVLRNKADAAISVPVKVTKKSEGITVPGTVDFTATSKEATLAITYPSDTPECTIYDVEIELTGEHVDAFLEGYDITYAAQIAKPKVVKGRTGLYNKESKYGEWYTTVWVFSDDLIMLPDLWGSGIDVKMYTTSENADGQKFLGMTATSGYEDQYGYEGWEDFKHWWFYDDAEGAWDYFYPFGEDAWMYMTGGFFYHEEDQDAGQGNYSYFTPSKNRLDLTFDVYLCNNAEPSWEYLSIRWGDSALEGFEPYLPEEAEYDVPVTATVGDETFDLMGTWNGYNFIIEDMLGSYCSLVIELDENLNVVGFSGDVAEETDGSWSVNDWAYFADDYQWLYLYPDYSTYDYDSDTFTFEAYAFGWTSQEYVPVTITLALSE